MIKKLFILLFFAFLSSLNLSSQCKDPFVPSFSERTSNAIKISWLDNNTAPIGYQLAHGEKGVNIQNAVKSNILSVKNIKLENLISGASYNFWIRTICGVGDSSKWVGPYAFTTYITNPSPCEMKIDIKDNSCSNNSGDVFFIQVDLGSNSSQYILQSVSLIIQHTWPADLKVELESPIGESIILSQFNGTVSDNYGSVNNDCSQPAIFSDEACQQINESSPPFIGSFIPEESLSNFNANSNNNGLWKLKICDDAFNDRGTLKYVKLNFEEFSCTYVHEYYVSKVNDISYNVTWKKPDNCVNMQVYYRKKGATNYNRKVVNCDSLSTLIDGLTADSEYEFYMVSNCGGNNISSPSCVSEFRTQCQLPKLYENFDDFSLCEPSCIVPCYFESYLFNSSNDDSDWIVNIKETPTVFSGPTSGAYRGGNYIYVESNPIVCGTDVESILETKCLKATNNSSVCDLNFFYHMFGSDIGTLKVDKNIDGKSWNSIFEKEGEIGNEWINENISLDQAKDTYFRLRFVGITKDGIQSDIALDEISLSNSQVSDEITYYYDQDGDGFGDNDSTISLCSSIVPNNFTNISGDCNDRNPEVNPSKEDIPCNLIDENCDGVIELEDESNPLTLSTIEVQNESCKGKNDGNINLTVVGGTEPYIYLWNNNEVIEDISNLGSGKYIIRITDVNGCGIISDTIIVGTISDYEISIENIELPSCLGKQDGEIIISHTSLFPPNNYLWSNGDVTKNITNAGDGVYTVTVTDNIGCVEVSEEIVINAPQNFNAITSLKRNPFCFGQSNGILEVQAINGITPYTYLWSDDAVGNRRNNLPDGNYILTITDNEGCKIIYEDSIVQPDKLDIKLLNVEPARCFGNNTGIIKTQTLGGTPPYNYSWGDGGPPTENRNNLPARIYSVILFDINGCSDTIKNILVAQPQRLDYKIDSVVNSSCFEKKDGEIFTTVSGGIAPYEFYWNGTDQFTEDVDSLISGTYTLTVLDANRCKLTTEAVEVSSFNTPSDVNISALSKNICPDENKATIKVTINSNSFPLDFNWSNGTQKIKLNNTDTIINLPAGTYNVTITDHEGCVSISNTVNIDPILSFNPTINLISNICKEDSIGEIAVTMSGGTPPYIHQWSNGKSGSKIDKLPNNKYSFITTDKNQCEYQSQIIQLNSLSNISCDITSENSVNGLNNGSCIINPKGGVGAYKIEWQFPLFEGFVIDSLTPATYRFTLTDDLDCSIDSFVIIDAINIVEDIEQLLVDVFPNPTKDKITIENYLNKNLKVTLFSIDGMMLKTENVNQRINTFDLSDIPEGIYFLRLNDERFVTVYRIFVVE